MKPRKNTMAITLRPGRDLVAYYQRVAIRANQMRAKLGQTPNLTMQQVMLHRLATLPAYRRFCGIGKSE